MLKVTPMSKSFPLVKVLIIAGCVLSAAALAQTSQGSIAGTVVDATGAVIGGAQITAKNTATGAVSQTESSSAGDYRLPNLNAGTYDVTANFAGFKAAQQTGVVVQVATTTSLNITMQPGEVTETVTVTGGAPTVEAETADVGTVVTTKQVLDLPLALGSTVQSMRSPEAFVFLTPGTVGPGTNGGGSNGATTGGPFESKITGGQNYSTEVLLDGASMYRSENGSSFDEAAPSVEALGEFRVETSTMPAEYGRTTGGIEIFSTKAGTNNFHGDAYDLFRNEDLDANSFYNNYLGLPRVLDKQNDYGGTFGGPVWIPKLYNGRDKTFFFFSWEQYRQNQGGSSTTTVPTALARTGDFSETLDRSRVVGTNPCENNAPIYFGEIFDPTTTRTVDGVQCRTSFLSETGKNAIPSNLISPIGQKLLSYYPAPLTGGLVNNYTLNWSFPLLDTTMTFRIDQNIGQNDKIYFTYSSRDNSRFSTNPIFPNVAGAGRSQDFFTHYMRLANDYTISPTMLDHLNLGFNRTNSKNVGAGVRLGNGQNWNQTLGIPGASGPTFPGISPGESTITGFGDTVDNDTIDYGYRINDTLDWVKGKHSMRFGIDVRPQIYEPGVLNNTTGSINFARAETAGTVLTNGLSGNGIASMLLGLADSGNVNAYASQARWRENYWALFAQDSFKITPTLTLNYGLRWDVEIPRWEVHGNTSNISLTAPNPAAGGRPGALVFAGKGPGRNGNVDEKWANTYWKDFAPRLGFAWAPGRLGGKTVLRGGYGIYYAALQYADFGADLQTGFQANPQFNSPNGFTPAFTLASGFPGYAHPPFLDPSQVNFQGNPANAYIDPSYGRPAMVQNWSMEVQHQLATDLILDVAYVGEHSTHLRSNFDPINRLPLQYLSLGGLLTQPMSSSQVQAAGFGLPYAGFPTDRPLFQALQPYPQYFVLNTDCCLENLGQSSFNALEVQLRRRFHAGLNLLVSYTYSKTMTDADSAMPFFATLAGGGSAQNPFDLKNEKAVSNQDIPHNLVISYIYELPVGKGKKFLNHGGFVNAVLGGWAVSGIHTYHSGQPFSFCCATGAPTYGSTRFDYVLGQPFFTE
ncbi:MAG TPA: TonB-dependent receptor, partial [Bryobacteraceae bacterium]|nr:TonB-dependent receptor [Bryobacteraceae bacterium]